jgi:hypothetical protein
MNVIYVIGIAVIGLIMAIGVGIELSKNIDSTVINLLFWMLYITTIITSVNIIIAAVFYLNMRYKTGPPGIEGPRGDRGTGGSSGICTANCRDDICYKSVIDSIQQTLNQKINNKTIPLNNTYILGKVKQMCSSDEYKQLAPYNGNTSLTNYLINTWKTWVDLLYNAGGNIYFETIGAETEWEWLADNPFDEIKKYDVFYWGLGPEYRPQLINQCFDADTYGNPLGAQKFILKTTTTDIYDKITNDDGVGAYTMASFWRPRQFTYKSVNYYPIGDVVFPVDNRQLESYKSTRHIGNISLSETVVGPPIETILVAGNVLGPIDYTLTWSNKGKNGNPMYVWRPLGPHTNDGDYIALGDVITTSEEKPPTGEDSPIRCILSTMLNQLPSNYNTVSRWASTGSAVTTTLNLVSYSPNSNQTPMPSLQNPSATSINPLLKYKHITDGSYYLFRGIIGNILEIPSSDINGSFYEIKSQYLDVNTMPGSGSELAVSSTDKVGKGYLHSPVKDSKYSILTYLNMKTSATLTHNVTRIQIIIDTVPNATGIIYTIKVSNKCIKHNNGVITLATCDNFDDKQLFTIDFTNNIFGQCRFKVYNQSTPMYLVFNRNNTFLVVNDISNKDTSQDLSLFTINP